MNINYALNSQINLLSPKSRALPLPTREPGNIVSTTKLSYSLSLKILEVHWIFSFTYLQYLIIELFRLFAVFHYPFQIHNNHHNESPSTSLVDYSNCFLNLLCAYKSIRYNTPTPIFLKQHFTWDTTLLKTHSKNYLEPGDKVKISRFSIYSNLEHSSNLYALISLSSLIIITTKRAFI